MVEQTAMWEMNSTDYRGQVTVKKAGMGTATRRSCSSSLLSLGPSNPSPCEQAEME